MTKLKLVLILLTVHFYTISQLDVEFTTLIPRYTNTLQFNYTGALQTWTVPSNVTSIIVEVYGAQGGDHPQGSSGGKGGFVKGIMVVSPGSTLNVIVGGKPTTKDAVYGFGGNGGFTTNNSANIAVAGGGLSCISSAVPINHSNVTAVAGGGGGAATIGFSGNGGDAGGSSGADGIGNYGGTPTRGRGGSQTAGGAGGSQFDSNSTAPSAGSALLGGNGGVVSTPTWTGGGGGGAGYFGGGGGSGGGNAVGSGGGGSSFASPSMIGATISAGLNTGHGKVIIQF